MPFRIPGRSGESFEGAGFCPACGSSIAARRYISNSVYCSCGWYNENKAVAVVEDEVEKAILAILLLFAVALIAIFVHISNWGHYSAAAPLLQIQRVTRTLSADGYDRLVQICRNLGKPKCAESVLFDKYRRFQDPEALVDLAKLQVISRDVQASLATMESYLSAGGLSSAGYTTYGKVLEILDRGTEARTAFERALNLTGKTELPIEATAGLVRQLMKNKDYQGAIARIQALHALGKQAQGYLNTELMQAQIALSSKVASLKKKPTL